MPTRTPRSSPPISSFEPVAVEKPKRNIVPWIIGILVALLLALFIVSLIVAHVATSPSGFSAVYLTSGDVFIGKLSLSGTPTLTDAWVVSYGSSTGDAAQQLGPVNLIPFQSTSVSPDNTIHISQQQILYWANLNPASMLVKELETKSQ